MNHLSWCKNHQNYVCDALTPEWFKIRNSGKLVSGSRVGQMMGYDDWRDRDDLIESMRHPSTESSRHMLWGSEMEVPNLTVFRKLTGLPAAPVNAFFRTGTLGATIDGIVLEPLSGPLRSAEVGKQWVSAPSYWSTFMQHLHEARAKSGGSPWLVEMKQTGEKYKTDWGKQPPKKYWAQVQTQLHATELDVGLLVAKVGTADMRAHVVYKDEFFMEEVIEEAAKLLEEI